LEDIEVQGTRAPPPAFLQWAAAITLAGVQGRIKRRGLTLVALAALALAGLATPASSGHDRTPPQTSFTGGPGTRTADRTPTFRFSSNEKKSSFICKRDGEAFVPCSSPKTTKKLTRGRHGFYVKAIDPFGNVDPTAAAYVFKVVRR
jgi:hypothetical protein